MPVLSPTADTLSLAADVLRSGGLVAFPTETVYGLGALALDTNAISKVYAAKRRPRSSPLIAHVESVEQARSLVSEWPEAAQKLVDAFWPGPLTLVLPRAECVPDGLTGGLDLVGVRQPAHPVALALIRAVGAPLAAPSANPFMQLSPTTALHVEAGLGATVDIILDGGPCAVGIESSVLKLHDGIATLLRPGAIPRALIEQVLGVPVQHAQASASGAHESPGMHARHYAPRTPLMLWQCGQALPPGNGVLLTMGATYGNAADAVGLSTHAALSPMPAQASDYARLLYARLHTLDAAHHDWIAVELPPATPEWAAVHDRLQRAAQGV